MCSSSPARTPKLQLTAEQPLTGKCWTHQKKDTQGQRRNPSKMVGGAKSHLESNPICSRDARRAQTNLVHTRTQRTHETEPELCLSLSRGGTCQQWPAAGAGSLGAAVLGVA